MSYYIPKFREWELDRILDVLFLARYHEDYMVVYMDGDLGAYGDSKSIAGSIAGKDDFDERIYYEGKFRPDMVVIDKQGRVYIVEAKIKAMTGKGKCNDLVVQTLVYANHILSPKIGKTIYTPYEFVKTLWKAHWYVKYREDGKFLPLEIAYKEYFGLERKLKEDKINKEAPHVLFLLPSANLEILMEACKAVKKYKRFSKFKEYAESSSTKKGRKRLDELKKNWRLFQDTKFYMIPVDKSNLMATLGNPFSLV
ncbi:hypothetical protein KAW50_03225 [candidate division WOR-3 bacterium]|nr:hypothetical protein [candidate division WOR-3 bacterium]